MNTHQKHKLMVGVAKRLVITSGGIDKMDNLPEHDRSSELANMVKSVMSETGTRKQYARRAVAKACRLLRGEMVREQYDSYALRLPKSIELYDRVKNYASYRGISVNDAIVRILDDTTPMLPDSRILR